MFYHLILHKINTLNIINKLRIPNYPIDQKIITKKLKNILVYLIAMSKNTIKEKNK